MISDIDSSSSYKKRTLPPASTGFPSFVLQIVVFISVLTM
jgi:hypothetical protein